MKSGVLGSVSKKIVASQEFHIHKIASIILIDFWVMWSQLYSSDAPVIEGNSSNMWRPGDVRGWVMTESWWWAVACWFSSCEELSERNHTLTFQVVVVRRSVVVSIRWRKLFICGYVKCLSQIFASHRKQNTSHKHGKGKYHTINTEIEIPHWLSINAHTE